MDRLTMDLRQIDQVDVQKLAFPLLPAAPRHPASLIEGPALKSAVNFGKSLDPRLGPFAEVVNIGGSPPRLTVLPPAPTSKPLVVLSRSKDLTAAIGGSISAFALAGILEGAGIYGHQNEIGVYLTVGGGIFLNIGAGGSIEFTLIAGTPADFSGPYIGVEASFSFTVGTGVGATLLFLPGPGSVFPSSFLPPFTFMGFALSYSVGPSLLPVTISVTATFTSIKPVVTF